MYPSSFLLFFARSFFATCLLPTQRVKRGNKTLHASQWQGEKSKFDLRMRWYDKHSLVCLFVCLFFDWSDKTKLDFVPSFSPPPFARVIYNFHYEEQQQKQKRFFGEATQYRPKNYGSYSGDQLFHICFCLFWEEKKKIFSGGASRSKTQMALKCVWRWGRTRHTRGVQGRLVQQQWEFNKGGHGRRSAWFVLLNLSANRVYSSQTR